MKQEEKAKRYDEALEELRGLLECVHEEKREILEEDITSIFPELKESEDEKIRKVLIELVKCNEKSGYKLLNNVPTSSMVAWLEKQGEQKLNGTFVNVDDVREDFIDEVYRVLDADPTNDRANQIIDAFDNLPTVTIKQDPCEHCKMTYSTCYSFPCDEKKAFEQGKSALEAIKEEKVDNTNKVDNTDKNDLKFHTKDWIVFNKNKIIFQIKSYNSGYCTLEDIEGKTYFPCMPPTKEDYHLWTIQDAKDGDVIYSKHNTENFEWIGIFKSLDKENKGVHFYGFWNNVTKNFTICGNELFVLYDDFSPATKEQRNMLMKVITESGYEWDDNELEAKKIENVQTC